MPKKVTTDTLADSIRDILEEYGDEVKGNLDEITKKIAQKGQQAIKNESKSKFNGKRYWKGWKVDLQVGRLDTKATIYNESLPGLPHLLEYGHAKRGGGRVQGTVHIAPVEEQLVNEFEKQVRSKL